MSSFSALRYTSGPLHSGHTSMSSSLLSTPDPLQHEIAQPPIYPRIHGKDPMHFPGERLAFYRILFGHHDRVRLRICDVGRAKRMMVREGMRDEIQTEVLQVAKETAGVADACDRVQAA